ncbi:MAG: hypothetical protein JWM85_3583 [Acidimicrobiaceae bacterium]|nr:hypothetical protein [Acidimicrobiaceae bacterium]
MSPDVPAGMGGFFPGMFGDLLRLLRTDSPIQWDLAAQLAQSIGAEGEPEANVEPVERMRLEELTRIAELQVADVTGMTTTPDGRPIEILPTTRAEWVRRSLEGWRELIEGVAAALGPPIAPGDEPGDEGPAGLGDLGALSRLGLGEDADEAQLDALLGQWSTAVAPAMIAMQVGSVVGHLSRRTLGQYELPLPRRGPRELLVIPANLAEFIEAWSLPPDDARLWLVTHDVATHAVLSRPHVAARLEQLLVANAAAFRPDPQALEARLGEAGSGDFADLGELTRLLGEPGGLTEAADTPELRRLRAELSALVAVIAGWTEWATDAVAGRTIASRASIKEALHRRRVERGSDERVAEALFGLHLDQEQLERGEAFVRGVLERGGETELAKLWVVESSLPTPAEVDAPGLWIERVNLPIEPRPEPEADQDDRDAGGPDEAPR